MTQRTFTYRTEQLVIPAGDVQPGDVIDWDPYVDARYPQTSNVNSVRVQDGWAYLHFITSGETMPAFQPVHVTRYVEVWSTVEGPDVLQGRGFH